MTDTAIEIQNVSKRFKLYHNPITGPIKELISFWDRKKYYKEFMAVKDVSIKIKKGEIVGIIGPNGAGKSTLLKMIAGLLPVDYGNISVHGKVTALLALGVGVHPEFTGRENVYYGGMLLGMSREEVLAKTAEIIEFSELGEFIDSPFRTYSSGMKARLLFAISMSINPDILIVDEALATGDTYFVRKCSQRIQEICESGATILFVSHNLRQIEELCRRAFLMIEGRIVAEDTPSKVIAIYYNWNFDKEMKDKIIVDQQELQILNGTGEVQLKEVYLRDVSGEITTGFYTGEKMQISLEYINNTNRQLSVDLFLGFLLAKDSTYVGEINTVNYVETYGDVPKREKIQLNKEGCIELILESLLLFNNHYSLWIIIFDHDDNRIYCEYKAVKAFFVGNKRETISRANYFWHPCKIISQEGDLD